MQNPLDKVVFIQKVAGFIKTKTLKGRFQLAYVNNSWNDTIKNYAFHLFEQQVRDRVNNSLYHEEDTSKLQIFCDRVLKCDVLWFVDVLLSSKTLLDRVNVLMLVCENRATSLDITHLVFDKIIEAGGPSLLKSQLTASDTFGWSCLMYGCRNCRCPEVLKLVFETIVEVGGKELLKSELAATDRDDYDRSCLMIGCGKTSSPEVMKLLFEKIIEVGGRALLKSHLTATTSSGWSCLMYACRNKSSSPVVVNLVFEKIVEVGDTALLKSQLATTTSSGWNCLRLGCRKTSSSKVLKLVVEKIVEVGDTALLKSQLTAATDGGWTCLMLACLYSSSAEVLKLVFEKIVEVGDTAPLLQRQLTATSDYGSTCLMLCVYKCSSAEVVKVLAVFLFELGLFKEQYAKLDDDAKAKLSEKAGIKDASWVPDPQSLAEVKEILQKEGGVARRNAKEELAAKNKAEACVCAIQ